MAWRILVIHDAGSPFDLDDLPPGTDIECVEWPSVGPARFRDGAADLIVSSTVRAGAAPVEWFTWLRDNPISIPVFALLPADASDQMLRVAAECVTDFATWPVRRGEIRQRIARILGEPRTEVEIVHETLVREIGLRQLVGRAPAFLRVIARLPSVARSNRPVLITGETGTGKELCARAIHHLGRRRNAPFIPVDCGAVPDHLFENELFGHERGAFTDAHRRQKGLIGMADGGTLLLDEIDSLPPLSQTKLLRFLEERTYRPLGADRFERADVNVVAATNRDLDALVRERRFRSDLFFRLNVLRLHLVPLRERRDDIPLLARHFLASLCADEGRASKQFSPAALDALQRMPWPGNVRELYNVVQQAFVAAEGLQVLPAHLSGLGRDDTEPALPPRDSFRAARARALAAFERQYVTETLRAHKGNITQAARSAQQDRRAFGRLVKRHKIDPHDV